MGFRNIQEQVADLCEKYGGIADPMRWVIRFPNGAELSFEACMDMSSIDELKNWLNENVTSKKAHITILDRHNNCIGQEATYYVPDVLTRWNGRRFTLEAQEGNQVLYVEA
jgi:hypothetical protein